jgi:hypothetical protein
MQTVKCLFTLVVEFVVSFSVLKWKCLKIDLIQQKVKLHLTDVLLVNI